jgi:hypothetical protein
MFKAWIEASYHAQAPKKLVAALDAGPMATATAAATTTGAKRPARRRRG